MQEIGKVVEVKGESATVNVEKKAECEKCGMCLFSKSANSITFSCNNELNAKAGDDVLIERAESGKFLGVLLVFLVPLLLIGVAGLITYLFIGRGIFVLSISIILIVIWYAILATIDKKLKNSNRFKSKIVAILPPANTSEKTEGEILEDAGEKPEESIKEIKEKEE